MSDFSQTLNQTLNGLESLLESERYEMYALIGYQLNLVEAALDELRQTLYFEESRQRVLEAFETMETLRNQILRKMEQHPERLFMPPNFSEEAFRDYFQRYQGRWEELKKRLAIPQKKKKIRTRV